MIDLKDIKQVKIIENLPTKWDDLDWENPMINDPRYLYSIIQAMIERHFKERTYPVQRSDTWYYGWFLDDFSLMKNTMYSYRYFEIVYSWVISTLQDFINPDTVGRAWKFIDNQFTVAPQLLQYNDSEMSAILGYDYRELPKPFQPFEYYSKFLKGMKNAVQAMNWVYWPLMISGTCYGDTYSLGDYNNDGDNWTFKNGSFDDCYADCLDECISRWNRLKEAENADLGYRIEWSRNFIRARNDQGNFELKGTYDNYHIGGYFGEMTLESLFKWNYETDIKVYYVPHEDHNARFRNTEDYKSWLVGNDFGNQVKLFHEEKTIPNKRYICSRKVTVTNENLDYNRNFNFVDPKEDKPSSIVYYSIQIYPRFFALLDISGGCVWK